MRWAARLVRGRLTRVHLISVFAGCGVFAAVSFMPATSGATGDTWRDGQSVGRGAAGVSSSGVPGTGQPFGGTAAVGALFTESSGRLGGHFCTASVVHSPHGDLAITAAHCVTGAGSQIAFVPGYASGAEPYGVWQVTQVYTDRAWQSTRDPDDDVAFLRLSGAAGGPPVEAVTGAELVGAGAPGAGALVRVIGYPNGAQQPVWCAGWTKAFGATQLEFDCDGYTNGTSGGPFLAGVSASSGQGTIIGVIGGYQEGGDTPQVSYSPAFGAAVAMLYQTAQASG
jgi:V8-like Glu-specific endopeptidase